MVVKVFFIRLQADLSASCWMISSDLTSWRTESRRGRLPTTTILTTSLLQPLNKGILQKILPLSISTKKDKDRRDGNGRRGYLGDVLECRTNHLAAGMISTKAFGRTSILLRWSYGMVRTG